ncbi:MAG: serine/threonine protein kinase [Planctomycetes bacterium]|nr:serine/threonine protein kinase [Planctomycetota bacterium]
MTARHDKTIVQSEAQKKAADMSATSATVGQLSLTGPTGAAPPRVDVAPPTIPDVTIEKEIGRGGMGVVYRGRQPYIDRNVAVKLLLVDKGKTGDEFVKRFQREAKILAGLSHPHIVACYQAGLTADGNPYLVMEFIDGPNLREHVSKHGPLAPADAIAVVRDMSRALSHAHASGIIHRDVKPENVLLAPTGKPGQAFPWTAKLVDLGLARPSAKEDGGEMNLTMQGMLMGTPATMAPEQFDDPDHVDYRADIYGLGCVLYHALTGTPAFNSRTLGEIVSSKVSGTIPNPAVLRNTIPREVADLVTKMLARDRAARPQSYEELIATCDRLAGQRPAPKQGSAAMWWSGAVIVLLIGVGGVFLASRGPNTAAPSTPLATTPERFPGGTGVAAPTRIETPASASPEFGEASSLFGDAHDQVMSSWKLGDGAMWTPSEDIPNAISGAEGVVSHALNPPPWRIEGTLIPGTSLSLGFGVASADGEAITVHLKNLIETIQGLSESGHFPDVLNGPVEDHVSLRPATSYPLVMTLIGKRLEITLGGKDFKPVQVAAVPTTFFLTVKPAGPKPAAVSDLTVRSQK